MNDVVDGFAALALTNVWLQLGGVEDDEGQVGVYFVESQAAVLSQPHAEAHVVGKDSTPHELGGIVLDAVTVPQQLAVFIWVGLQ